MIRTDFNGYKILFIALVLVMYKGTRFRLNFLDKAQHLWRNLNFIASNSVLTNNITFRKDEIKNILNLELLSFPLDVIMPYLLCKFLIFCLYDYSFICLNSLLIPMIFLRLWDYCRIITSHIVISVLLAEHSIFQGFSSIRSPSAAAYLYHIQLFALQCKS